MPPRRPGSKQSAVTLRECRPATETAALRRSGRDATDASATLLPLVAVLAAVAALFFGHGGGGGTSHVYVAAGVSSGHTAPFEELRHQLSVAVAWMLMGGFAFMMSLFYLTNHSDDEIRMYSWQVISSTVSIFCAVLTFSSVNDLVGHYFKSEEEEEHKSAHTIRVDFMQMWFWIVAMMATLWYVSRRAKERCDRDRILNTSSSNQEHHLNMQCWATIFAHTAGFAAINCFGDLQQTVLFSASPVWAFLVVPITVGCMVVLWWALGELGETLHKKHACEIGSHFFAVWEEKTEEAENDIAALAISFLTCQALRFHTGGVLPDPEGHDLPATQFGRLLLCSAGFAALAVVSLLSLDSQKLRLELFPRLARAAEVAQLVCCMCCAWCTYYGVKRFFFSLEAPEEEVESVIEEVLRIKLAVCNSCLAFAMIFCLNAVVDREKVLAAKTEAVLAKAAAAAGKQSEPVELKHRQLIRWRYWEERFVLRASQTIIKAMAILVGFSWEQAFDASVEKTCEHSTTLPPAWAKLILAALMVGMVLPGWRFYILPQVH